MRRTFEDVINFIAALKLIPVDKMSKATHFKSVDEQYWQIANPEEEDAMELGLNQIDLNLLLKPTFTIVRLKRVHGIIE